MHKLLTKVPIVVAAMLVPFAAQARDTPPPRAKLLQQAIDCALIKMEPERLACYDRTVAALAQAEENKQIVVADREQIRDTRRSLFGLRLSSLGIFGGDKDDNNDDLAQIDTTISSVGHTSEGGLALTIADGARWVQTDSRAIVGKIAPGTKVVIRRGTMGSYFASIPGRPGFKVERRN